MRPTTTFEKQWWSQGKTVIGIDEVGRGSLAGPLVIAAVKFSPSAPISGVADSKQLSAVHRCQLAQEIKAKATWNIISIPATIIDTIGIQVSWHQGIGLLVSMFNSVDAVLVDGKIKPRILPNTAECCPIVRGDQTIYSIAAASIIAKTWRDSYMEQLSHSYPAYSWHTNVGYGTKAHLTSIKQIGLTCYHRQSFIHI